MPMYNTGAFSSDRILVHGNKFFWIDQARLYHFLIDRECLDPYRGQDS